MASRTAAQLRPKYSTPYYDLTPAQDCYTLIASNYDEIAATAALVGIDWAAHCNNISIPCEIRKAAALDKKHKGKVGIKIVTDFTYQGVEYPRIIFSTFKDGHTSEVWNGLRHVLGTERTAKCYSAKEVEARKAAQQDALAAQQAKDKEDTSKRRIDSLRDFILAEQATESRYLAKKQLTEYASSFKVMAGFSSTSIAYKLTDLETGEAVGYQWIDDRTGKKGRSKGSGDCVAVSIVERTTGSGETVYITEGLADALTVHKVTGEQVISVLGTGQIKKAAAVLAKQGKYKQIVVLADNDTAGLKAASFDAEFTYYVAAPLRQKDFSDVYVKEGAHAVAIQAHNASKLLPKSTTVTQCQRYCDFNIQSGAVSILTAEKGTGKTTAIKLYLKTKGGTVLIVVHRRSLAQQFSREYNVPNYEDVIELQGKAGLKNHSRLVISCEQLAHLDAEYAYDTVIIDESDQVLEHIAQSSTLKNSNRQASKHLIAICNNAKTLVLSDANTGAATEYLADIISNTSNKPIQRLTNTFKVREWRGDSMSIVEKKAHSFAELEQRIKAGCPIVFVTDSLEGSKKAHAIALKYLSRKDVLLFNSETTAEHANGLVDIDSYIAGKKAVIYSPMLGTGFSITEGHQFKEAIFCFGGNSITAESSSQMLARFRGVAAYTGFIGNSFDCRPVTLTSAKHRLIYHPSRETEATIEAPIFDIDDRGRKIIDHFSELYLRAEILKNRSKNDFRAACLQVFKEEGFTISLKEGFTELESKGTAALEERKEAKQAEKEAKQDAVKEAIIGAIGDTDAAQDIAAAQIEHRVISKGLKARAYANITKQTAYSIDVKSRSDIVKGELSHIELPHAALRRKTIKAIYKSLGIDCTTLATTGKTWIGDDSQIMAFAARYRADIYALFRVSLNKKDSIKVVGQLAKIIGLKTVAAKTEAGRIYSICTTSIAALHKANDTATEQLFSALGIDIKPSLLTALSTLKNGAIEVEEKPNFSGQINVFSFLDNNNFICPSEAGDKPSNGAALHDILSDEKPQKVERPFKRGSGDFSG